METPLTNPAADREYAAGPLLPTPLPTGGGSQPVATPRPKRASAALSYRCVTDADAHRQFIRNYRQVAGNDLPVAYLANALVYQFYRGDRAVAGFILNTSTMNPLRYFSYLDEAVCAKMLADEDLRAGDMLEICGNYKLKNALSAAEGLFYYRVMLTEAYRQAHRLGTRWLLGGSVVKSVKHIQQRLMNRIIYHGPIRSAMLAGVHEMSPLMKLYIIEVKNLPGRAVLVLANRYVWQPALRFFRAVAFTPADRISGETGRHRRPFWRAGFRQTWFWH